MHPSLLVALSLAPLSLPAATAVSRKENRRITPPDYPEPEGNTYPQLLALAMACAKEEVEALDAAMAQAAEVAAEDHAAVMASLDRAFRTPHNLLVQQALQAGEAKERAAATQELLAKHGPAVVAARELLAGPCLQPRGVHDDERVRLMIAFHKIARLLMVQARALQKGGDLDGALQVLCDLMRLSEVLARNARLIQALTGIAILAMAAHPLPACIHDAKTSDRALAELALRLRDAWERRVPAAETLAVDRVVSQEAADRAGAAAPTPGFPPLHRLRMLCWRAFEAREQAAVCHVIDLARQPRWERKPERRRLRRTIAPEAYLRACDRFDQRDAILARLRLQVALEQYRRRHGEAPGALTDLVPDFIEGMQLDPFTGEAFHYEPSNEGYRLYSQAETEGGVVWRGTEPEAHKW